MYRSCPSAEGCHKTGLVKLGVVALDGTKVAANAALDANRSHGSLEEEVRRMLAEAKAVDAEEDIRYGAEQRGDELPEGLGRHEDRLKRFREAKERLEREAEEEANGKKKQGRKPKVVEPISPEEAKANTTDPDSRIMKSRSGYVQGYNVQGVVSEDQIIVAIGVTQEANPSAEGQQLAPMLQILEHTLEAAGIEERPKVGLADAGYWSEANIKACSYPQMPELLIATTKSLPLSEAKGLETTEATTGARVSPRAYAQRTGPER